MIIVGWCRSYIKCKQGLRVALYEKLIIICTDLHVFLTQNVDIDHNQLKSNKTQLPMPKKKKRIIGARGVRTGLLLCSLLADLVTSSTMQT